MRTFALVLLLAAAPAARADVTVKLGTLAPEGSSFHNRLKEMGQKWRDASGGAVKLHIYPAGVAGNEGDMVRKMRVGQLSAGAFTAAGLHEILPAAQGPAIPQLIGGYDELDWAMQTLGPQLEKGFDEKGFVVLNWAEAGTAYFFTRRPAASPADMKGQKLFAWAGDPKAVDAIKLAGFEPVVVSATDMLPSLQTKLLDAFNATPLSVLALRWYDSIHNMTDFKWSLLTGATVITKAEWDKIPADLRPKLLQISREIGRAVELDVRSEEANAIAEMKKRGMNVVAVSPAQAAEWRAAGEKAFPIIRGGVVPAEAFDEVKHLHDEWQKQHPLK